MVWTLLCRNQRYTKPTHTPTSLYFQDTPFVAISTLQSYKSSSLHYYSNIRFCLVWERNPGFPGLWEQAVASQLPNSCRDKNVYLDIMLVLQIVGWTEVQFLCHPAQNNESQETSGSCPQDLPWQGCKWCRERWMSSRLEGDTGIGKTGHTLPTHRKPPALQKLTEIRNTHTQKFLSQANGGQITHRVSFGFLFFLFSFFFFFPKGLWSSTSTSLHPTSPYFKMTAGQGQDTEGTLFWRTSFFSDCLWAFMKTFSKKCFQQNMQEGILVTELMHLKQKNMCKKCKISPASRSGCTEDCFFRLNKL